MNEVCEAELPSLPLPLTETEAGALPLLLLLLSCSPASALLTSPAALSHRDCGHEGFSCHQTLCVHLLSRVLSRTVLLLLLENGLRKRIHKLPIKMA